MNNQQNEQSKEEKETQAQLLIKFTANVELFHTSEGEAYARLPVNGHLETWILRGKGFRLWLIKQYYEVHDKPPGGQAIADALNVLEAKALFEGNKQNVYTRVAEIDNVIYIDLCNKEWQAIKITASSWEIVNNPPIRFRRSNIMEEIPKPVQGGKIEELKPFINYRSEMDWMLIVSWLITSLRPNSPYPILTIQGEQGSAKSTTTRVLRALIDPSTLPLRALPKEERDLSIAANNTWILAFDNLSGLSNTMSDALCKLSTGGGLSTRKLYSDDEEAIFNIMRPSILNGIDDIAKRQDLLDRSLVVFLPSISEGKRKDEKTFWADFKIVRPRILGALFEAVSSAIKNLPNAKLNEKPRMVDFALWITAAEKFLGWHEGSFMEMYNGNRCEAIEQGLDSDPVGVAVQAFMKDKELWEDTTSKTLEQMEKYIGDEQTKRSKAWTTSNKLKQRLRRIAPALRSKGIVFTDMKRSSKGGMLKLENLKKQSTQLTQSTQIYSYKHLNSKDKSVGDVGTEKQSTLEKTHNIKLSVSSAGNVGNIRTYSDDKESGLI
ncbi:ATP-binding protein [Priestia megaterium]|uniref:ATP-binding protein n=1 Tax=Priestia megaterium TaxID=1404 RepID=UPI001145A8B6|nr:ATP-binding protein [Priestia megaterium]